MQLIWQVIFFAGLQCQTESTAFLAGRTTTTLGETGHLVIPAEFPEIALPEHKIETIDTRSGAGVIGISRSVGIIICILRSGITG